MTGNSLLGGTRRSRSAARHRLRGAGGTRAQAAVSAAATHATRIQYLA
jgi:hypothetical protein